MSDRKIGKVISVDSFRLVVQLDEELKSLYKSGFNDIYEIARINSYLIIPVGADRIVAIVTRVKIQDETEIEKGVGFITLPKAQRYLVATMIGTIENGNEYIQGVYNYPILDNPVWYVVKDDLDKIFDSVSVSSINYQKDFYLPIGTSPAFSDYKIKINPDKFFGKHAAILGNTGSGKSCTVASILQSMFSFEYKNDQKLQSANFIVFDTNGEYKRAFIGDDENSFKQKAMVNAFCIDKDGLKVPYWFMNFDDFEFLFDPSANTQTPILKRAISLAKNNTQSEDNESMPQFYVVRLFEIAQLCKISDQNKLRPIIFHDLTGIANYLKTLSIDFNFENVLDALRKLYHNKGTSVTKSGAFYNGHLEQDVLFEVSNVLDEELRKLSALLSSKKVLQDKNIDLPIWFNYEEMISSFIDQAINEQETSANRIREFVSTLRLRLQAYLNDERIANPLLLKHDSQINDALSNFLAFVLGDLFKLHNDTCVDIYSEYYKKHANKSNHEKIDKNLPNQVTIIDMSLLPFEVLETITGLIGRLILEFLSRFNPECRGEFPIVIVLEEAQNYIPEKDRNEKVSISKRVFERIAREGRKFGLSLMVSSQRPAELSKTVLSQCNSFIVHRLQNPEDQKYVRQLVSAANEDILQQLPVLPQQAAIIMGDGVRTPVQMKVNTACPKPNSDNPRFIEKWLKPPDKTFPDYKGIAKGWEMDDISLEELKENQEI